MLRGLGVAIWILPVLPQPELKQRKRTERPPNNEPVQKNCPARLLESREIFGSERKPLPGELDVVGLHPPEVEEPHGALVAGREKEHFTGPFQVWFSPVFLRLLAGFGPIFVLLDEDLHDSVRGDRHEAGGEGSGPDWPFLEGARVEGKELGEELHAGESRVLYLTFKFLNQQTTPPINPENDLQTLLRPPRRLHRRRQKALPGFHQPHPREGREIRRQNRGVLRALRVRLLPPQLQRFERLRRLHVPHLRFHGPANARLRGQAEFPLERRAGVLRGGRGKRVDQAETRSGHAAVQEERAGEVRSGGQ